MPKILFILIIVCFSCYSQNKKISLSDISISKFPSNSIKDIEFDSKGNSWLTQAGGNLIKFKEKKIVETYNSENSDFKYSFIKDISIDSKDNIWLASGNLVKFNGRDWINYDKSVGLSTPHPGKIFIDKLDRIWVIDDFSSEISILRDNKFENDFINKNPALKKARSLMWIHSLSKKDIWASCRETTFHYNGDTWKEFSNDLFNGSSYNYVNIFYNGNSNKYWLGTWHKGLVSVNKQTLEFSNVNLTLSNSEKKYLTGEKANQYWNGDIEIGDVRKVNSDELYIKTIAESDSILFIGTNYNGLIIKDGDNIYNLHPKNSQILSQSINSIKVDSENKIWIGTNNGLNILSYK